MRRLEVATGNSAHTASHLGARRYFKLDIYTNKCIILFSASSFWTKHKPHSPEEDIMRIQIVWCICAFLATLSLPAVSGEERVISESPKGVPGILAEQESLKSRYKVWGALAYVRNSDKEKDVTILAVILNEVGQEVAEQRAFSECKARKQKSCTVLTFAGCMFAVVGKSARHAKPVFGTNPNPDYLVRSCREKGFQCSYPIGGCNYVDADGNNNYKKNTDESPVAEGSEFFVSEKVF